MSYPAEDRHERDRDALGVSASSNRNPSQEKEKVEKAKVVGAPAGAHVPDASSHPGRAVGDLTSHKAGKPPQSRPIAPAGQGQMALHNVAGIMPGFQPTQQQLFNQLLRASVPQHLPFASHVPAGAAAAAAAAMAAPRSGAASAMMRTSGMPQVAKPGSVASQHHSSQGTPVPAHTSSLPSLATTTTSSSAAPIPPVQTTSAPSTQPQHSDNRSSDTRESRPEVRPAMMPEGPRRTASPHIAVQPLSSSTANQSNPTSGAKIGLAVSATSSQSSPLHKSGPPALALTHQPAVHPVMAVSNIATSSVPVSAISTAMSSGHQQPKMTAKMFPQHPALAAFQTARPPLSSTEPNLHVDHSRLVKPSGTASPVTVSLHHTTSSSVSHPAVSTPSSGIGSEGARIERPRQPMPMPGHHPYAMPAAYFFQPDAISGYPALHQYYNPSGFGANPSLVRPPTAAATAAAQAAQVAAAASGMGQIHMMDPRIISQIAAAHAGAMGIGAPNVPGHSSDASSVTTMADGGAGNASGIYGFPGAMFSVASSASLQSQMSAANPNATSPRPSILRKRTSEGVRKTATQLPFNESVPTSQSDPVESPRSDSTVSAPQSGQNSPKPPSDTGSQGGEQPVTTSSSSQSTDQPALAHSRPSSPAKVKEPPDNPVTTMASSTAMTNGVTPSSVTPTSQTLAIPAITATDVASSPRKKPRKQNVIPTEDKYGSTVPVEASHPEEEGDRKPKAEDVSDEDLKFILLKRPKISIFGGYKVNTKAAHNHFVRYSDVRVKEERKPTIQDFACQKGILQRANGWRVQHSAAQLDELNSVEQDVLKKMGELKDRLPKPKPGQKAKYQDELVMLQELVQGNIQRSQLVVEQLTDTRKSMVKILEHRRRATDMLQKQINKRNPKKKS